MLILKKTETNRFDDHIRSSGRDIHPLITYTLNILGAIFDHKLRQLHELVYFPAVQDVQNSFLLP